MTGPGLSNTPAAEVDITPDLVLRLLRDQHPDLASLPLEELGTGWDNVMFRLGPDYTVRLPRRQPAANLVEHEQRWLPVIGAGLPLPTPIPVRIGRPTGYYPWRWSVLPWFDGSPAAKTPPTDQAGAAEDLGRFLAALHTPAERDAPPNPWRGGSLRSRDAVTLDRIASVATDTAEHERLVARWRRCVDQPDYNGPSMWLHGDLHPFNILVANGKISAVIDFGDITSGDPATDLAVGFALFDEAHRRAFRDAAESATRPIGEAMWVRAEGWCLSVGLTVLANSGDNPPMRAMAERMIA